MATLGGQRAQFTWALNQYNLAETTERKVHFLQRMALIIQRAPGFGLSVEEVTRDSLPT